MNRQEQLDRMRSLIKTLREADRLYYRGELSPLSDKEYDRLYDQLKKLEAETGVVYGDSPTQQVGYQVVSSLPKKAHAQPMLSQNKTKSVEQLQSFLGAQEGILSWKLDGLTVVLHYEDGRLSEAVTRGDGRVGALVTANARAFQNIPLQIDYKGSLTLRGEALISYPDFEEINRQLPESEAGFKNPRNLCAGSVLQLNSQVTAQRRVRFLAFALVEAAEKTFEKHSQELDWLGAMGFEVVSYKKVSEATIPKAVADFEKEINHFPLPSDGLVLLMDDIAYGKSLGATAKFPRDSIAFKWQDETAATHLLEIEWSASRTGLINPVAVFEPVELEGTTVSRASVHNLTMVEKLALGPGDEIRVYKANMIIPQIEGNLTRSGPLPPPAHCPVCGAPTQVHDTGDVKTLYCSNPDCPAKQIKRFSLFVSRHAMNMEGLSEATLEKFLGDGILHHFADLFQLEQHKNRIIHMEGFGEKSFRNLVEAAGKASHTSMARLIVALGIGNVGPATARLLSRHFGENLQSLRSATVEELSQVEGIGGVIGESIAAYFRNPREMEELDRLLPFLDLKKGPAADALPSDKLAGLTFVITGSLQHFPSREALKELIEKQGGKVSGSVSSKTTALINNDSTSTSGKNQSAQKLGIPIIKEEDFLKEYQLEMTE